MLKTTIVTMQERMEAVESRPTGLAGGAGGNKSYEILKKMTVPRKTFTGKPE